MCGCARLRDATAKLRNCVIAHLRDAEVSDVILDGALVVPHEGVRVAEAVARLRLQRAVSQLHRDLQRLAASTQHRHTY